MVDQAETAGNRARGPSLARASSAMAVATATSRVSGLAAKVLLATVLGIGVVHDSYTVANTLPTVVNELVLGGVLTSIAVPLLVRAQRDGDRAGEAYAQWMITMATVVLLVTAVLAVLLAPALTQLYLGTDSRANSALTTAFAYLLLPGLVFYGLSALLQAVLNTRGVFATPAWAPVANNVVLLLTMAAYLAAPGEISTNPVRMGEPKLLVLGLGTMSGIAVQCSIMAVALRRTGFRYRWRWGWDHRLAEFGALGGWVLAYTTVSQLGMIAVIRVAAHGTPGSVTTFNYAWLLSQVPYGVLGVSLLTALMPRISRAAANRDAPGFVADLSLGTRMSSLLLVPISGLMVVAGPAIGVAFFSLGASGVAAADRLGMALAAAALGIAPYAVTMLQMRAFYALKDARTPTWINLVSVVVRAALCAACLVLLPPEEVVIGAAAAMSVSFLCSAVLGQVWLRRRMGGMRTAGIVPSLVRTTAVTVVACAASLGAMAALGPATASLGAIPEAWVALVVHTLVVGAVALGLLALVRAPELKPVLRRVRSVLGRGG
ncbi:murein biosynthesis integral membrane protein MurJ [Salinifilum aidingensis]